MAPVWIVHRTARTRAALARLAGLGAEAEVGAPGDPVFERAEAPRVIVLGLADDLEAELEFAHRHALRHPAARWILISETADRSEATRLFDTFDAEVLAYPPRREALRARIATARRARPAHSLEERRRRDALTARFVRYFGDLELPELLRALDPGAADLPLVIRGEPGTGRTLLARYVHGVAGNGPLLWVPGASTPDAATLDAALRAPRAGDFCVCIEDAETLSPALQHLLVRWIELGPPGRAPRRWIVTLGDDLAGAPVEGIEPALLQALAGVSVRIPPLREREERIPQLASEWLDEWCRRRGRAPRGLTEAAQAALRDEPWPDNLRELEAVLTASVARSPDGPLDIDAIRFTDGTPARPPDARPLDVPTPAPGDDALGDAAPHGAGLDEPDDATLSDTTAVPAAAAPPLATADDLPRLAGVLAHQIRNPLATIRTFAGLLPDHAQDPEFRERFRRSVEGDVGRIERAVTQLADFADFPAPGSAPVDLTGILEAALEERRQEIGDRRLVVLKELERAAPFVRGDGAQLRFALEGILDHALGQLPERGDLYLASKHLPESGRATNTNGALRVLLRFDCRSTGEAGSTTIDPAAARALAPRETSLELWLAERVVRAHGGELALDETAARERVIVVELPGA